MKQSTSILLIITFVVLGIRATGQEVVRIGAALLVRKCQNFSVNGKGDNTEWKKTEWVTLTKLDPGAPEYVSRFKILYSNEGIYLLFNGTDKKITTRFNEDFGNLYEGDVFEAFFHPDVSVPLYFEYEVNQLNKELVLMVPNIKGKIFGWLPWNYKDARRVKKMVSITGGKSQPNSNITSWSAELFFPIRSIKASIKRSSHKRNHMECKLLPA